MISLKITKERLKNHFAYRKLLYVPAIIGVFVLIRLILLTTYPEIPKTNRVDIIIYGGSAETADVEIWEENMLELLDEDQKEVNLVVTGSINESLVEAVIARTSAKEDDILGLNIDTMLSFMTQDAFIPLEEYFTKEEIESIMPNIDWSLYEYEIENEDGTTEKHIFFLPLDNVDGFSSMGINTIDLCMGIYSFSENQENAIKCFRYIIEQSIASAE